MSSGTILKGETISTTSFPLYTVRVVGDRHILVAGGGGSSKTGIDNAIEIYELKRDGTEQDKLVARKVTHHETGKRAIMNSAVMKVDKQFVLAGGVEGSCALYRMRYKVITPIVETEVKDGLRRRKGNLTMSNDHNAATKLIGFEIAQDNDDKSEVITDSSRDGGFQKAVAFSRDNTKMITAGADGYLRVWKYPSLEKEYECKAHTNEIDDIDISFDGSQIVSVSKDNHIYLWKTADGSKQGELTLPTTVQYRARNCRFGRVVDKGATGDILFTTHIVAVRGKRPEPSYLVKWNPERTSVQKAVRTGHEILSAMAISDDGIYVAVGSISGTVSVYVAFSLQRVYHMPEVHQIFVTGLSFMPNTSTAHSIVGNHDFTLFSISADNHIKVHQLEARKLYNPLWALLGVAIVIFLIFWFISAFGL